MTRLTMLLFLLTPLYGQVPEPYQPLMTQLQDTLDKYTQHKSGEPPTILPGITAAVRFPHQQRAFPLASGYADPSAKSDTCLACPIKMQTDFLVEVGSITKTFTSALMLQMEAENKVALNDTLNVLIPQVVNDQVDGTITLQQLMKMTSGTNDFGLNDQLGKGGDWVSQPTCWPNKPWRGSTPTPMSGLR